FLRTARPLWLRITAMALSLCWTWRRRVSSKRLPRARLSRLLHITSVLCPAHLHRGIQSSRGTWHRVTANNSLSHSCELTKDSLDASEVGFVRIGSPMMLEKLIFRIWPIVALGTASAQTPVYIESQKVLDNFGKQGGNPLVPGDAYRVQTDR